jgi:hypothetical protein
MDHNEQTDAFLYDLQNVVNRFRTEFDLNHATIVGCLEMVKIDYLTDSFDVAFEQDDQLLDDDNDDGDPF